MTKPQESQDQSSIDVEPDSELEMNEWGDVLQDMVGGELRDELINLIKQNGDPESIHAEWIRSVVEKYPTLETYLVSVSSPQTEILLGVAVAAAIAAGAVAIHSRRKKNEDMKPNKQRIALSPREFEQLVNMMKPYKLNKKNAKDDDVKKEVEQSLNKTLLESIAQKLERLSPNNTEQEEMAKVLGEWAYYEATK